MPGGIFRWCPLLQVAPTVTVASLSPAGVLFNRLIKVAFVVTDDRIWPRADEGTGRLARGRNR
ncbi:hypothetical protein GCM10010213_32230 [Microbacterium maritypicum]|nr:hypothetical protein GCM10010213_32230 [Microbacterium liquefaciens]